ICGLSGGVDSSVAASLVHRAVGDRLTCVFVDNGLLRKHERDTVERTFRKHMHVKLVVADAGDRFLSALAGGPRPQGKRQGDRGVKRKRMGGTFIDVCADAVGAEGWGARFLVQGTVYPDVIESVSPKGGPSATIKTHHNVGGLPADMPFELIEPLRELFKDEV